MKRFHVNISSDGLCEKHVSMLFEVLIGILVILFIAFIHTIISLIVNFIQNGYIDWEHFGTIGKSSHNVVSINEYIHCYWYMIKWFVIIYPTYYLLKNFWYMIKYNKFFNQFIVLENVPTRKDIMKLLGIIETGTILKDMLINKFLLPLINLKIQCIEEMNLLQKYSLFYTNNIEGLNIGILSTYRVSPTEVSKILKNINIPKYISVEVVSSKEKQVNVLNKNYYKGRATLMLQMVFNQKEILTNIIFQAFSNESEGNEYIRNDIVNQIQNYYSNKTVNLNDSKLQLLISAIKENMKKNMEFKEQFINIFNNSRKI